MGFAQGEEKMAISEKKFDEIKKRYGKYASWAVWNTTCTKDCYERHQPLDNNFEKIKDIIRVDYVMVGLNRSTDVVDDFSNFHTLENDVITRKKGIKNKKGRVMKPNTVTNVNRLIYTFKDSKYRGAYMTDILDVIQAKSKKIKVNDKVKQKCIENLKCELKFIGSENPLIIAFGDKVDDILKGHFPRYVKVPHYAFRRKKGETEEKCKKDYKVKVLKAISSKI